MTTSLRSSVAYALTIPPHTASLRSAVAYALVRDPAVAPSPVFKPTDIRKAQRQILYDLIEDGNPGFQANFPLAQLDFGTFTAITVDPADQFQRDTQIVVSAKAGSGFMGSKTIKYRRLDLSKIFRNMTLRADAYVPGSASINKPQWVAAINAKYGIALLETDWQSVNALPANNIYSLSIISMCYKASVGLPTQWVPSKRPMLDMIPDAKQVLVGRAFPAGNDFTTPGRKPVGEWETFGLDASDLKVTLEALAASQTIPADSTLPVVNALINWLSGNSGRDYFSNKVSTVKGGLCGLTWYKYTIPNAAVVEANSQRFNRVLVIQGVAGSWFSGKILLHYNV